MHRIVFAVVLIFSAIVRGAFEYSPAFGDYGFEYSDPFGLDTGSSEPAATQFTLTMAVSNAASTTPSVGAHVYDSGTVVNISQVNGVGYRFARWTRTASTPSSPFGDSSIASTTIEIRGNVTVTAVDTIIHYLLTVNNDGNGTTDPTGASTVDTAASTAISATASVGYHFNEWTVVSGSATLGNASLASTTVSLSSNAVILANFSVDIIPTDARSVVISPASLTIDTGLTRQFTATYYDTIGRVADPQPATTWAATIGSIDASGLFTAGSDTGTGIVRGYNGSIADTATVRVRYKSVSPSVNRWNGFSGSFRTAWRRFR